MKILIETECGETTCDHCDFKRLDMDVGHYCVVFRDGLGEGLNPPRLPACVSRFGTGHPHPDSGRIIFEVNAEQRASNAYAHQLAACRKLKTHCQNLEDEMMELSLHYP